MRPVGRKPLAVDQRHRNLHAVPRGHHQVLRLVVHRVEAPQDLLLLDQGALAGVQVQVVGGVGRGQRRVAVAQGMRIHLRVVTDPRRPGGVVEVHRLVHAPIVRQDPQVRQAPVALLQGDPVGERIHVLQQHVLAVGNHLVPGHEVGAPDRALHEAEVRGVQVGQDQEAVALVVDVVLQVAGPRLEDAELAGGVVRLQDAGLGAEGLVAGDHKVAVGFGAADVAGEGVVVLLVDQHVVLRIGADAVAPDLERAQGLRILLRVEQGAVVQGPGHVAGHLRDHVRKVPAGVQVAHMQVVEAAAHGVHPVDHIPGVGTDLHAAQGEIPLVPAHGVAVEHDLLGRVHRALPAAVQGVFAALLVTGVVPVAVQEVGGRGVVLLDAALQLGQQRVLQRLGVGHHGVQVGVLGVQVIQDLGVVPFVQPVVVVNTGAARGDDLIGLDGGDRGLGTPGTS